MDYIKEFQEKNNLLADGVIGKKTLLKMKEIFNLPSDEATAHFIGQIDHETAGFKFDKENLNYSSAGLISTFKKYFPTVELANQYARKPEKIANRVYANRMGNGPENSGDGWKFAGKGSLQLTGRLNYTAFSFFINNPEIVANPNTLLPEHYWNVAVFFFNKNNLFNLTNTVNYDSIRKLTRKINGGYNGLQHRFDRTMHYYNILKKKKKKKVETKQDERQDISSTDSVPDSYSRDILVSKKISRGESVSSSTRDKKENNSAGFIDKIIRWILSKIGSGYSNKAAA